MKGALAPCFYHIQNIQREILFVKLITCIFYIHLTF